MNDILEFIIKNADWKYSYNSLNIEEMWNELHGKLCKIKDVVPVGRFDCYNRSLNMPWSNSTLKRMHKKKDIAWNKFNEVPSKKNVHCAMSRDKIYSDEELS